jgi:hypothetical protein
LDVVDDGGLLRALERHAPHRAPRAHTGNAVTRLIESRGINRVNRVGGLGRREPFCALCGLPVGGPMHAIAEGGKGLDRSAQTRLRLGCIRCSDSACSAHRRPATYCVFDRGSRPGSLGVRVRAPSAPPT